MKQKDVKIGLPYAFVSGGKPTHYYIHTNRTEKEISYYAFRVDTKTWLKDSSEINITEHPLYPADPKKVIPMIFEYKEIEL